MGYLDLMVLKHANSQVKSSIAQAQHFEAGRARVAERILGSATPNSIIHVSGGVLPNKNTN